MLPLSVATEGTERVGEGDVEKGLERAELCAILRDDKREPARPRLSIQVLSVVDEEKAVSG